MERVINITEILYRNEIENKKLITSFHRHVFSTRETLRLKRLMETNKCQNRKESSSSFSIVFFPNDVSFEQ